MEHLSIAISSMWKRKLSVFLMMTQLVLSFWVMNHAFISMDVVHYQEKKLFAVMQMDKDTTLRLSFADVDDTEWFAERFSHLENFIKQTPGVQRYGSFDTTSITPENLPNQRAFLEQNKKQYAGTRLENAIENSKIVFLDKGIYSYAKFKIINGRPLGEADFTKKDGDVIPVLIGYNYRDVINLGDRFETIIHEKKIVYEVVGVLEQRSEWLSGNDYIADPVDNLDNFFLAPFFPIVRESEPMDVAVRMHNTFIQLDSVEMFNQVSAAILEKGRELGINPTLATVGDELQAYRENRKQVSNFSLFMGMFFLVISIIGIVSVTLSSIHARKHELGVRMVAGATKRDISMIILMELVWIVTVSAVSGVMLNYVMEAFEDSSVANIKLEMFAFPLYGKVMLVSILVILSSVFIPLLRIKKLQLRELVGGRD
jgi:putative ABC transport system permease protein